MSTKTKYDAFKIPYVNHFLSHALKSKAQQYTKVRLFRKGTGTISSEPIHEEVVVTGKIGELTGTILHYSFQSLPQVIAKFTEYAKREVPVLAKKNQRVQFKHFTLYPIHMFWSIFIEDQGYTDGIWGFGLAVCFAFYEFMRYWYLFVFQLKTKSRFPLSRE